MSCLNDVTDSMDMNLSTLCEVVKPGVLHSLGSQRVGCDLVTEQQKHMVVNRIVFYIFLISLLTRHQGNDVSFLLAIITFQYRYNQNEPVSLRKRLCLHEICLMLSQIL